MNRPLLCLTAFAAAGLLAAAEKAPLHPSFRDMKPDQEIQVIVRFSEPVDTHHHQLVKEQGGKLEKELKIINAGVYRVPRKAIEPLLEKKEVLSISPDQAVTPPVTPRPPVEE